jgi:hypothetical protein
MLDRKFASLNLFFLLCDPTTANPQKNYRIKIANPEAQKSYLTSRIRPKGKCCVRNSTMASWVERDLCVGDLRALSNIAFGRSFDGPHLDQVERLCKRGFLTTTARGTCRMTMTGWVAVLVRNTSARRKPADKRSPYPAVRQGQSSGKRAAKLERRVRS